MAGLDEVRTARRAAATHTVQVRGVWLLDRDEPRRQVFLRVSRHVLSVLRDEAPPVEVGGVAGP